MTEGHRPGTASWQKRIRLDRRQQRTWAPASLRVATLAGSTPRKLLRRANPLIVPAFWQSFVYSTIRLYTPPHVVLVRRRAPTGYDPPQSVPNETEIPASDAVFHVRPGNGARRGN